MLFGLKLKGLASWYTHNKPTKDAVVEYKHGFAMAKMITEANIAVSESKYLHTDNPLISKDVNVRAGIMAVAVPPSSDPGMVIKDFTLPISL